MIHTERISLRLIHSDKTGLRLIHTERTVVRLLYTSLSLMLSILYQNFYFLFLSQMVDEQLAFIRTTLLE